MAVINFPSNITTVILPEIKCKIGDLAYKQSQNIKIGKIPCNCGKLNLIFLQWGYEILKDFKDYTLQSNQTPTDCLSKEEVYSIYTNIKKILNYDECLNC